MSYFHFVTMDSNRVDTLWFLGWNWFDTNYKIHLVHYILRGHSIDRWIQEDRRIPEGRVGVLEHCRCWPGPWDDVILSWWIRSSLCCLFCSDIPWKAWPTAPDISTSVFVYFVDKLCKHIRISQNTVSIQCRERIEPRPSTFGSNALPTGLTWLTNYYNKLFRLIIQINTRKLSIFYWHILILHHITCYLQVLSVWESFMNPIIYIIWALYLNIAYLFKVIF